MGTHTNNWLLNIYTESCGRDKSRPYKRFSPQKGQGGDAYLFSQVRTAERGFGRLSLRIVPPETGYGCGRMRCGHTSAAAIVSQPYSREMYGRDESRPLPTFARVGQGGMPPCFVGASGCGASPKNTHKQLVIKYLHGIMWTR